MLLGMQQACANSQDFVNRYKQDESVLNFLRQGNILSSEQGISSEELIIKIRDKNWIW